MMSLLFSWHNAKRKDDHDYAARRKPDIVKIEVTVTSTVSPDVSTRHNPGVGITPANGSAQGTPKIA
jgi:hypothetical protein